MRKAPSFCTGHYKPDSAPFNWSLLAKSQQTLAIYMGHHEGSGNQRGQLIAHGHDERHAGGGDFPWLRVISRR